MPDKAVNKTPLLHYCFIIVISCSFIFASNSYADENSPQNTEKYTIAKASKQKTQVIKDSPGFIVYGNWCGLNHPTDMTTAAEPIDLLDSQCKTHDYCYFEKGDFDCGCDRTMVLDIDQNQKMRRFTTEQYLLAQNIKLHFALSPCNGDVNGNKALPTRILTHVYKKSKDRIFNTYDRLIGNRFPAMQRNEDPPTDANKKADTLPENEINKSDD